MESVLSDTPAAHGSSPYTISADTVPAWRGTASNQLQTQARTAALDCMMRPGAHLAELKVSEVDPADSHLQRW